MTTAEIKVQTAKQQDHLLAIVNFQISMAKETEKLELDSVTVSKGVQSVFDDPSKGRYFVATHNGEVIASLLTMNEWSDWRCGNVIWIHSVYVTAEHRKKGVFRKMYQHLQQLVESSDDLKGLRLYVDKSNQRAQATYEQLGMSKNHYHLYEWLKDSSN